MQKELILTREGYKKLANELDFLIIKKRREIAGRIKDAKELGDLAENSEYEDAKNEQAFIEGRIAEIEGLLKNAKIIDKKDCRGKVVVGSSVSVTDQSGKNIKTKFSIVGSSEGDPANGRISFDSPIGKALLGKKKGEVVGVETPGRKLIFKVLEVN